MLHKLHQQMLKKEISSKELIQEALKDIAKINLHINVIFYNAEETALIEAERCDSLLAKNKIMGPLHGIPFTVKDTIFTEGIPTTAGTKGMRNYVPQIDAVVVQRLKKAGAVVIGKTNCPELEFSADTENLLFGRTKNPWHFDCSPGSSSGGEASAVASSLVAFGIGEDTTASLRLPAHYCGVFTIKPTSGRVPRTGHIPYPGNILDGLWQLGPIARTTNDLELILSLISGPDWNDPSVVPMPFVHSIDIELSKLRIAYHTDNKVISPTEEIQRYVREAAYLFKGKVNSFAEDIPPMQAKATELCSKLYSLDKGVFIKDLLHSCKTEEISPSLEKLLAALATNFEKLEVNQVLKELYDYQSKLLQFFKNYDVLICPPMPDVALTYEALQKPSDSSFNQSYNYYVYQIAYCLLGLPMVIVPVALSKTGLPITVQLVGAPWSEAKLLKIAATIEQNFPFNSHYQALENKLNALPHL